MQKIIKKIKLFNNFKKIIKENETTLEQTLNIRVDKAHRLYTVLNIPQELIGEAYSLRKSDVEKISENYVRQYITYVSEFLNKIGLNELYKLYKVERVDRFSYLIVIGFSLFKSNKYYNNIYYKIVPAVIISIILIILLLI